LNSQLESILGEESQIDIPEEDLAEQMDDLVRQHDKERDENQKMISELQVENARLKDCMLLHGRFTTSSMKRKLVSNQNEANIVAQELMLRLQERDNEVEELAANLDKIEETREDLVSELELL